MVYTSDLRAKNLLRGVHARVLEDLKKWKLVEKVRLRIFDNDKEDGRLWQEGGLTFKDPETGRQLGSNDCAWYTEENNNQIPLVVVEGTFGTERGQFGDGQLNRLSHPLGVARSGHVGVLLQPYEGESYVKGTGYSECNTSYASMKYARVRKIILQTALEVCKSKTGLYLVIDAYEPEVLQRLVVEAAKSRYRLPNSFDEVVTEIEAKMKRFLGSFTYEDRALQLVNGVFDEDGQQIPNCIGRVYTHNYVALTTSTKRDGHGMLGKSLAQSILSRGRSVLSIFIRLTSEDLRRLSGRRGKESTYVFQSGQVVCLDDLVFQDKNLEHRVRAILSQNLHEEPEKSLIAEVINAIDNGKIRISRKRWPRKPEQPAQLTLDNAMHHS